MLPRYPLAYMVLGVAFLVFYALAELWEWLFR